MSGDFLQSLQVFVRVAESGGFSRAADQLGMAASSVTASVQRLERLLGELSTLSRSLQLLTEQTRRDPRGLIFGNQTVPNGPGESGEQP